MVNVEVWSGWSAKPERWSFATLREAQSFAQRKWECGCIVIVQPLAD